MCEEGVNRVWVWVRRRVLRSGYGCVHDTRMSSLLLLLLSHTHCTPYGIHPFLFLLPLLLLSPSSMPVYIRVVKSAALCIAHSTAIAVSEHLSLHPSPFIFPLLPSATPFFLRVFIHLLESAVIYGGYHPPYPLRGGTPTPP